MKKEEINVHEAISNLINERLKKHLDKKIESSTCLEIYQDIFYTLTEIFKQTAAPLGNESANILSQMYYDCVSVETSSGMQELDPNIFEKRAAFDNIPTKEIALMATMMRGTPFAPVFLSQIKKRS